MDPTGGWQLELVVNDKRMGSLLEAREKSSENAFPGRIHSCHQTRRNLQRLARQNLNTNERA